MSDGWDADTIVVGAGPAGVGVGVALSHLDLDVLLLERDAVGASLRSWPEEMRFITPSFPSNGFDLPDLNAIVPETSPAVAVDREHPSGDEYAEHLEALVGAHGLTVGTGVEVTDVRPIDGETETDSVESRSTAAPERPIRISSSRPTMARSELPRSSGPAVSSGRREPTSVPAPSTAATTAPSRRGTITSPRAAPTSSSSSVVSRAVSTPRSLSSSGARP